MHQHFPNKVVNAIYTQMSQHSPANIYKAFQLLKKHIFKFLLKSKPN